MDKKKDNKEEKKDKKGFPIKKFSIISGIGGTLLGGFLLLKNKKQNKIEGKPIDLDESVKWIFISTEKYSEPIDGELRTCYIEYILEKTNFFVVNILSSEKNTLPIYYVTPTRVVEVGNGKIESSADSFYAVVGIPGEKGKRDKLCKIQKGKKLVFHTCIVGGAKNGVFTGDKLYSKRAVNKIEIERVD